jgi:hypothetical protein
LLADAQSLLQILHSVEMQSGLKSFNAKFPLFEILQDGIFCLNCLPDIQRLLQIVHNVKCRVG